MLTEIIFKEILNNIKSPKFSITFVLSFILIELSIFSGIQRYETSQKEYARIQEFNRSMLESKGSWGEVLLTGLRVMRKPEPLSIFNVGLDGVIGKSATISRYGNTKIVDSYWSLHPVFALFGDIDITMIVLTIFSFFALLFSYDAISGEKERGTLKLILSNPVSRDKLILGKIIGGYITLVGVLIIPVAFGCLYLFIFPGISLSKYEILKLFILILSFFLYLLVFFAIGVAVSTFSKNSAISFLYFMVIWISFVIIIPRLSVKIATIIHRPPVIEKLYTEQELLLKEFKNNLQNAIQKRFDEYIASRKSLRDRNWAQKIMNEEREKSEKELSKKFDNLIENYYNKEMELIKTSSILAKFSPTSTLSLMANEITGTGINIKENFIKSLNDYKNKVLNFIRNEIKKNPRLGSSGLSTSISISENNGVIDASAKARFPSFELNLNNMPEFVFFKKSNNIIFKNSIVNFAILILYFILFFTVAFVKFLKYDVR